MYAIYRLYAKNIGENIKVFMTRKIFQPNQFRLTNNGRIQFNKEGFLNEDAGYFNGWSNLISTETYVLNEIKCQSTSDGYYTELVTDSEDFNSIQDYLSTKLNSFINYERQQALMTYAEYLEATDNIVIDENNFREL